MNSKEKIQCSCGPDDQKEITFRKLRTVSTKDINGIVFTAISSKWSISDHVGRAMVRVGINRMNYAIAPGLYAVGNPNRDSNVFISCNYKLSFDILRRELAGIDSWILVIDTKGVNVWCAAGKGTFGTQEIIARVKKIGLTDIVSHKNLILPQLGAPGVAAHLVKRDSGFNVIYGPVRASDIGKFLTNGLNADAGMRRVSFNLADRLTVSLLEIQLGLKSILTISSVLILLIFILNYINVSSGIYSSIYFYVAAVWIGYLSGTFLFAVLLPYLPFRAFSLNGAILGLAGAAITVLSFGLMAHFNEYLFEIITLLIISSSISSYLALNYTGASTFTSLSGVKKELKIALPAIISSGTIGVICAAAGLVIRWSK